MHLFFPLTDQPWHLGRWFVSLCFHMNVRLQGFPAEYCTYNECYLLHLSVVFNVVDVRCTLLCGQCCPEANFDTEFDPRTNGLKSGWRNQTTSVQALPRRRVF